MIVTIRYQVELWNDEQWEPTGPTFVDKDEAEEAMLAVIDARSRYARVIEERTEVTFKVAARTTYYGTHDSEIVGTLLEAPEGHR